MKLIIFGTSDIARCAYEYFTQDSDYEVCGFTVDRAYLNQEKFLSLPLVSAEELEKYFPNDQYHLFIATGSQNLNRLRTAKYFDFKHRGYKFASYVSSRTFVWPNVVIGDNCFILEHNTLQPFVKIGNNVTLWSGNHIGHSSVIHDHAFITSHVVVSGFCEIGESTFIGVNACLADTVKIGKDNFIGMNSAVTKSTKDDVLIVGPKPDVSPVSAKRFCKVKE